MRAKSAEEIVRVAACKTSVFDDSGLFFAPVFDGWVLPLDPLAAFRGGRQHEVPIIVGSTLNEGATYLAGETDLSLEKYCSFLKSRFGEYAGQAYDLFSASEAGDVAPAIDRILTVGANAQPARLVARSMERVTSKAYLYQFTRRPKTALARRLGVHHGVDLAYVFGNMDASDGYDDTDRALSRTMMDTWVNFARTGNPNSPGLPDWPAYASATDINLEFSEKVHTNQGLFKKEADFIERTKGMQSDHATAEQDVAEEHTVDPHAAHVRFRFEDQEMDFVFGSLILGATANKGCEIGEAFRTAANISDGDAASWQEAWIRTARLVEARGAQSLAHGHAVSARDQFQRASNYYRAALVSMLPGDSRFQETALKSRELLKKAGTLFHPRLETIEIPFEGTVLPGYFRKAAEGKTPTGTLIMIGGAETFAEDLFFYIAHQAFDRGYNFLTVDLPGQGLLPLEGKFFRPAMQVPIEAVVDYALGRGDVDPGKLAVYGISSGGGFVPQAAAHDRRIKAVVMNNCVVDAHQGVAQMAVASATPEVVRTWSSFKRQTNQMIAWRFGVDMNNLPGLVEANRGFCFDPARVTVPALDVVASGEYRSPEVQRQTWLCIDMLPNPRKKLVITPAGEGAFNHCVMENRSLMSQEVFDWLDEIFTRPL